MRLKDLKQLLQNRQRGELENIEREGRTMELLAYDRLSDLTAKLDYEACSMRRGWCSGAVFAYQDVLGIVTQMLEENPE